MVIQIVLAVFMIVALFILFLVISQTTANIDNVLYKLEYLLRKEYDIKLEAIKLKYKLDLSSREHDEYFEEKRKKEEEQKKTTEEDERGTSKEPKTPG
ncbi:MAG: hypothetical protein LBB56_06680 [Chitinispirillales bacterium]|nr:hypothetical protein [Chitinispirillales bacterium]